MQCARFRCNCYRGGRWNLHAYRHGQFRVAGQLQLSDPYGLLGSVNTATLLSAGRCTIQASQAGNASYAPATPISQTFTVGGFTMGAFNGNVTLSCSGGPAGSYCVDLPQTVFLNGIGLAVSGVLFPAGVKPGNYTITCCRGVEASDLLPSR